MNPFGIQKEMRELPNEIAVHMVADYSIEFPSEGWSDIRSIRPRLVSVFGHFREARDNNPTPWVHTFDLTRASELCDLRSFLELPNQFVFHDLKPFLFGCWSMGLNADLRAFADIYITARCQNLGASPSVQSPVWKRKMPLREMLALEALCRNHGHIYCPRRDRDVLANIGSGLRTISEDRAAAILQVYHQQKRQMVGGQLDSYLNEIEFPSIPCNARMEWNGVNVPTPRMLAIKTQSRAECIAMSELLRHSFNISDPNCPRQFQKLMNDLGLYDEDWEFPSLSCLRRHRYEHQAVESYYTFHRYKALAKARWRFGIDGRIHPVHVQLGAVTSRNTCITPNLVGLPKKVRPMLCNPTNQSVFVLADFSQYELCIAACKYGDIALLGLLAEGDLYIEVVKRVFWRLLTADDLNLSVKAFKAKHEILRNRVKPVVLRFINSAVPNLDAVARELNISLIKAQRLHGWFQSAFPALSEGMKAEIIKGRQLGYSEIYRGLTRHVDVNDWRASNILINTPIQGLGAVIFKIAIILTDKAFAGTSAKIILPIHDAMLVECARDEINLVEETLRACMVNAFQRLYPFFTPRVDVKEVEQTS